MLNRFIDSFPRILWLKTGSNPADIERFCYILGTGIMTKEDEIEGVCHEIRQEIDFCPLSYPLLAVIPLEASRSSLGGRRGGGVSPHSLIFNISF